MSDIRIRKAGRAGRITLARPAALNAVTWAMLREIEAALDLWRGDDEVALVVIDAEGERAFSAGGDVVDIYEKGRAGDFAHGQRFWADEYRLNAKIREYPKPYVAFMQGFTMGGGVGVSCHGSHRVVGVTSRVAMPECAIGLIPDVGGTLLLSRAPGRLGEYLGITGYRMGPGDAIYAGFADHHIPEGEWPDLIAALESQGEIEIIARASRPRPATPLEDRRVWIDGHFHGATAGDVMRALMHDGSDLARETEALIRAGSPLAVACAYEAIGRVRGATSIRRALEIEYRFTSRAVEKGELLEGIRAAIIDKDRRPRWRHASPEAVTAVEVAAMLRPLAHGKLQFEGEPG